MIIKSDCDRCSHVRVCSLKPEYLAQCKAIENFVCSDFIYSGSDDKVKHMKDSEIEIMIRCPYVGKNC